MKILILGSSGFVGRNMYEHFNDRYDVQAPKHNELDVTIESDVYAYLKKNTFDVVINALDVRNNDNCYFEQRMRMYANL